MLKVDVLSFGLNWIDISMLWCCPFFLTLCKLPVNSLDTPYECLFFRSHFILIALSHWRQQNCVWTHWFMQKTIGVKHIKSFPFKFFEIATSHRKDIQLLNMFSLLHNNMYISHILRLQCRSFKGENLLLVEVCPNFWLVVHVFFAGEMQNKSKTVFWKCSVCRGRSQSQKIKAKRRQEK